MASSSSSASDSSISDESQLMELLSKLSSDSSDSAYTIDLTESHVHLFSHDVNLRYNFPGEYNNTSRRDIFSLIIPVITASTVVDVIWINLDEESVQQTDFMKHIAEMIRFNTSVKHLILLGLHGMTLDSAALIGSALSKNQTLHGVEFSIGGDAVRSLDAEIVELLLAGNRVLKKLVIKNMKLRDDGARHVATILHSNNTSIRSLILFNCSIESAAAAAAIGTALGSNNTLEVLELWDVDMGADGVEPILQALTCTANKQPLNTTLKDLRIISTEIGSKGIDSKGRSALANMLRNNSSLLQLHILGSMNKASEEDICCIFESLTNNTSLEELDLCWNDSVAGEKVFATIEDLLASNLSLKILDIIGTPLAREGKEAVIKARLQSEVRREQALLLKEMNMVSPKAARVFLCGDPLAGKTTLRKSMMYATTHLTIKLAGSFLNSISRMRLWEWLWHGGELRTSGVEVSFLTIGNTNLTLWDMAGQKEFHSFHDLVVPNLSGGGSSSLFLLVCNPFDNKMNIKPDEDIKRELIYWLQFIASNTRRSQIFKPHVTIVVTHADQSNIDFLFFMIEEFAKNELKRDFGNVIKVDLYDKPLDARSVRSIRQFLEKLKKDLVSILEDLPKVFEACVEMQLHIEKWNQQHPNQPLVFWNEFVDLCKNKSIYKKTAHDNFQNVEERFYRVIAASLHEAGQILYFEELAFVVINPNWFCHEIMGKMTISPIGSSPTNGFINKGVLKNVIARSRGFSFRGHMEHKLEPESVVKLMMRLKLFYEDPNDANMIFIPATLRDENGSSNMHHWQLACKDPVFIGRRLQCSDKIRTSLTLGFFPRLQVYFHEKLGPSTQTTADYTLSRNTIEFLYNGMEIKLQCTSDIGYDIDIFVRSSKNKEKTLEFVQKNLVKYITDLCGDKILGCQGVVLLEGILRPECVMSLTPPNYRKHQSILVEDLKQTVLEMVDLQYSHSWNSEPDVNLRIGSDTAMDLLSEHEWEDVLERCRKKLGDVYRLFKSRNNPAIEDLKPSESSMQRPSRSPIARSLSNIVRRLDEVEDAMLKAEEKILKKTNHIMYLQENMKLEFFNKVDEVIDFSWQLQTRQVPRYVFFTTMDVPFGVGTIVTKLVPGMKRLQLHLMCEHKHGFHKVEGQEGITLTVTTEVARRILPILKWSFKLIALLVKVGAHVVAGLGGMISETEKAMIYALDAGALDEVALGAVDDDNGVTKSEVDLNQPATEWLIEVLGDRPKISKLFGLYQIKYKQGNEIAWVCSDHKHIV